MDGIDVAWIETDGESDLKRGASRTFAYDNAQTARLAHALEEARSIVAPTDRPGSLSPLERDLTHWHANAIAEFCRSELGASPTADIVGFHGQTVLHRPKTRLTVQLGDGALLARLTRLDVVNDFRSADVAAGGEGAPLVPVYHRALAAGIAERPLAFVNIGGIANITWVGPEGELLAFDTGPGNGLINDWMSIHDRGSADTDGQCARRGKVIKAALERLMDNPFFASGPPKSLDRKSFSLDAVRGLSLEEGAATLTQFTARSIAAAEKHLPRRPKRWIICGGGRRNPSLMAALDAELDAPAVAAEAHGFNGDSLEAEAFAYLAVRSLKGLPITFPGTTGVSAPLTGGVLHTA